MTADPMTAHIYQGAELELFQLARNWKTYYARRLRPFISGDVLEVGAGLGGTTPYLCAGDERTWTCLEPDQALLDIICQRHADGRVNGVPLRAARGTLNGLPPAEVFQTILYIDVLEHIERDAEELEVAASHLAPGGHLIVLSPAHQWLYSEFDRAIGHFRRYTARDLRGLTPAGTRLVRVEYLDSLGAMLSLVNRWFLKQEQPRPQQIAFWDRYVLSVSKLTDLFMRSLLGRSVVGVWARK